MADGGRNITIIAGVYTLIEGLLWSLLSIYYIAIHDCMVSNPLLQFSGGKNNVNTYTLLYASYFNGSSCSSGGPHFNGLQGPVPSSTRTYYWMIGYAIVNAIWIPVSVLLIVSAVCKVKGNSGTYFYVPWILVTSVITIADIIAVVIYSFDISHTMSLDDYIRFLEAKGTWEMVTGSERTGQEDSAAPAVIMTLFFSRFIVFLMINISFIYHCFQESREIRKFNLQGTISAEDVMDDERFRTWNRPNVNRPLNVNSDRKLNDALPTPMKQNRNRKFGALEVNINEDKNIEHENESPVTQLEESKTNPKIMYKVDEFGIPIEEIRIPRVANSYTGSSESDVPIASPVFDYLGRPAKSQPTRNRSEHTNGMEPTRPKNLTSQELLRGQAPWSYLHPLPTPASPPIPAPDYTENPSQNLQQFSYTHSRPSLIKRVPSGHGVHVVQ